MEYIKRLAEDVIKKQEKMFKIILITGARQVGKTTMLKKIKSDISYITLDDMILNQSAIEDPQLFLKSNKPPIIIDEIQYAPNLLRYIKIEVDNNNNNAMFYLTGSQQFHLMKDVSESLAGRIGQLLNLNSVANEVGISLPTAQRWLSILVSSNIVYLLEPYYTNIMKRAIKTPKIYFFDTGLVSYLTKWKNRDILESSAMAGNFFENFVVIEIIKSYYNIGELKPPVYFYRDKDKKEIDLIIEQNGKLYPIEIKKSANPSKNMIENFKVLDNIKEVGEGAIICMYDKIFDLDDNNKVIPYRYL